MGLLALLLTVTLQLSEVNVTGHRSEVESGGMRLVTTLTAEEVQLLPVKTVADLLQYIPGLDVRQRGASGVQMDPSIRGGSAKQVKVLLNGIDNYIVPAYSALTVWYSAGVGERLKGQLTETEFHSISAIIRALLDEGPVAGISEVEDPEEHLLDYLAQAEQFELGVDDCRTLLALDGWAAQEDVDLPAVAAGCADLLSSEKYRDLMGEILPEDDDGEDDDGEDD